MGRKLNMLAGTVNAPLVRNSIAEYARSSLPGSRVRRWQASYLRGVAVADSACAVAVALATIGLYYPYPRWHLAAAALAAGAFPVLWLCALLLFQGYSSRNIEIGSIRSVINAGMGLTLLGITVSYLTKINISPVYVLSAPPAATLLDLIGRYLIRRRLQGLWFSGRCLRSVIAVGDERSVAGLIAELRRQGHHGLVVVGACIPHRTGDSKIAGVPVLGSLDDVLESVIRCDADTVAVLSCPEMDAAQLRSLAWQLEKTATDLYIIPSLFDVAGPRTTIKTTAGLTMVQVEHPQLRGIRVLIKGSFDRVIAAIAIILLSPLLAGLAVAIRLSDGGPALFRQTRVGKDGRVFRVYKFRTMVVDAEKRLAELRAVNDADGVLFKMRQDPRVTALGSRLRRWSLDELPELLNVLRGDMSLVGPRPALPDEAARYADHVRRRLAVKPGITGLWQVSGRWDLSWDETVRLDLRYVENWSLALDLQILWKTVAAVTRGTGAY
jgi:exopolysaccharide biosynthesis polyprenyl glycosylphosphotransferase